MRRCFAVAVLVAAMLLAGCSGGGVSPLVPGNAAEIGQQALGG